MDIRNTVVNTEAFLSLIAECRETNTTVSLLADLRGLTRVEGHVLNIYVEDNLPKTKVEMEDGSSFFLEEIMAVNGMFRSDYSEC